TELAFTVYRQPPVRAAACGDGRRRPVRARDDLRFPMRHSEGAGWPDRLALLAGRDVCNESVPNEPLSSLGRPRHLGASPRKVTPPHGGCRALALPAEPVVW